MPTERVLARVQDADDKDERYAGLSKAIRESEWAVAYAKHAQEWHADARVLICEGTARSSPLVLPTTTYYATREEQVAAANAAVDRYNAQMALAQTLPLNAVAIEIPNRRMDDANGDIAEDRADASDFYKGNSAAYVSAFRDTGVLDFAFAWHDEATGTLTHGA